MADSLGQITTKQATKKELEMLRPYLKHWKQDTVLGVKNVMKMSKIEAHANIQENE